MSEIAVLKFGGSSVRSIARIENVARIVCDYKPQKVVVIVSAMGDTTDHLLSLARQCSARPDARELDLLLSTGEQVSIALLSLMLSEMGVKARSYTGQQAGIVTSENHGCARILDVDIERIRSGLSDNDVVVVAGFQGITPDGEITTLGRGGSDTTAVALAAALGAKECDIYTDVDGVFTADPNVISDAVVLDEISYFECIELARSGAQVIHPRAVELAQEYDITVRVRNTFNRKCSGTSIKGGQEMEKTRQFSGVALDYNQACISIRDISKTTGTVGEIVRIIASAGVIVDLMSQLSDPELFERRSLQLSCKYSHRNDILEALRVLQASYPDSKIHADFDLCKVTLVGKGVKERFDSPCRAASLLENNGIEIELIQSGEVFISCLVRGSKAAKAAKLIHQEFDVVSSETGFVTADTKALAQPLCLTA